MATGNDAVKVLGSKAGLGTNLGVSRPAGDDDRSTTLWGRGALGVGLTEATSAFFELYGFNREGERGPDTATFQAGVVYLVSPDLQLDARVGRRLTDQGVGVFAGAGPP